MNTLERAGLLEEIAVKLREVAELEQKLGLAPGVVTVANVAATTTTSSKAKSSKSDGRSKGKGGRRPAGQPSMKDVVLKVITSSNKKSFTLAELTKAVLDSGYETTSNQPSSIVYQAANKLVNSGDIMKVDNKYTKAA